MDNTRGADDIGVFAYRNKLQELCENSEAAKQRVPLDLLRFYDAHALQRQPMDGDLKAVQEIRSSYGEQGRLPYISLEDAAVLFTAVSGRDVTYDLEDKELRLYIDFLHIMGAITHSNASGLDDLIIIDPMWLLMQETAIVRRPALHPRAGDDLLPATSFRNLYERGVLEPELIPRLWEEHPPRLQLQLLGMMVQVGRISEDYLLGKKKRGAAAL